MHYLRDVDSQQEVLAGCQLSSALHELPLILTYFHKHFGTDGFARDHTIA